MHIHAIQGLLEMFYHLSLSLFLTHTHMHTHTDQIGRIPWSIQIMTIILAQIVQFVKTNIMYGIYEKL